MLSETRSQGFEVRISRNSGEELHLANDADCARTVAMDCDVSAVGAVASDLRRASVGHAFFLESTPTAVDAVAGALGSSLASHFHLDLL